MNTLKRRRGTETRVMLILLTGRRTTSPPHRQQVNLNQLSLFFFVICCQFSSKRIWFASTRALFCICPLRLNPSRKSSLQKKKQKKPEHNFSWKDLSYSNTHTIKCTICQGSFDSNKILFFCCFFFSFKPIYISYIYLFGVYGSKNRHLNHKERMGG